MNRRRLVQAIAGGAALLLGVRVLVFPHRASPRAVMDEIESVIAAPGYDQALVVRSIDRVLGDPRAKEDAGLMAELLWMRAEVHAAAGHYSQARADIEQHMGFLGYAPAKAVLRSAQIEALEGRAEDALTRVRALLEEDDSLVEGWRLAGRLQRDMARGYQETALRTADELLVRQRTDRARKLLTELSARDPSDDRRLYLSKELGELYLPHFSAAFNVATENAERSATHNAAARLSLARAMGGEVDSAAFSALLELLRLAGQPQLAIDLATATYPPSTETHQVLASLLESLTAAGQFERMADRVKSYPWLRSDAPTDLCMLALERLWNSGAWMEPRLRPLTWPLKRLRILNQPDTESAMNLYQGFANFASAEAMPEDKTREAWLDVTETLTKFIEHRRRLDPFPGAQAPALLYRARAWRALDNVNREREDLGRALTPEPDDDGSWLKFATGEDYLRHAELVLLSPQRGARRPEEDWTAGMGLMPERTAELLPRWEELGAASLAATGHDIERLYTNMVNAAAVVPTVDIGPWARWRLASMNLERHNPEGAIVAARRLLESYPGLIPAYDLLIEAQLTRGSRMQVTEDVLRRVALVGPDETHARYVGEIGVDAFSPAQRLRLMQHDPEGLGRRIVAEHFLASGEPARSLRALGPAAAEGPPGHRLLAARALGALGREAEAEPLLQGLLDDLRVGMTALEELVRDHLADGGAEAIETAVATVLQRFTGDDVPPRTLALTLVDRALDAGSWEPAQRLLEELDARVLARGGDVLWRLAVLRLLTGDREGALSALERAEATITDGRVETARIAIAIEDRDWRDLPRLVAAFRAHGSTPPARVEAILTLLEERLEAATETASASLEQDRNDPEWALIAAAAAELADAPFQTSPYLGHQAPAETKLLLRGGDKVVRDPRDTLGALLLLGLPDTAAWTEAWLEHFEFDAGTLWPAYLRARLATRRGRLEEAERAWSALTEEHPEFGPAWDGLIETLRARRADRWHDDVLRAMVARRKELGRPAGGTSVDRAVDQAADLYLQGSPDDAARALAKELDTRAGEAHPGRAFLARLLALQGKYQAANREFAALIPTTTSNAALPWVQEYTAVLDRGSEPDVPRAQRIEAREVAERLAELQTRFPYDPLLPLERARHGIEREGNAAQAVAFALRLLDSFRKSSLGLPLDDLRAGSAARWGRFLLELSPPDAERFLLSELERSPGDVDQWTLLAEALAAQGRTADARDLFAAVVRMSDDPFARHDYAWELVQSGASAEAIDETLAGIEPGTDPYGSPRTRFVQALASLRGSRPNLVTLSRVLEGLWRQRANARGVPVADLGRTYGAVLLMSGTTDDLKRLAEVLDDLDREDLDPYSRTVFTAYRGLERYRRTSEGRRSSSAARLQATQRSDREDGEEGAGAARGAGPARAGREGGGKPDDGAQDDAADPEGGADSDAETPPAAERRAPRGGARAKDGAGAEQPESAAEDAGGSDAAGDPPADPPADAQAKPKRRERRDREKAGAGDGAGDGPVDDAGGGAPPAGGADQTSSGS